MECISLSTSATGVAAARPLDDRSTLTGKVMCGYQGWFNCAGDGAELGWTHWARSRNRLFAPGNITVDLWPDMAELDPDERFVTGFHHADGRKAEVFESLQTQDGRLATSSGCAITGSTGRSCSVSPMA